MPKNSTPTAPVPIKLSDLIINAALSGRSPREIKENAKALQPAMASKGWDETQPGAVFERDGKFHLSRGFTRVHAATEEKVKTGFFFVIPDDPEKLRTEALRSNMGKPISAFEQGRIFTGMRDGTPEGTELKAGEVSFAPMTIADIAKDVDVSATWVSKCIAVFNSPPEIQTLLEEDRVSYKVVDSARKLAKDDEGKWVKIVKAAIRNADADGKATATEQHFKAIKDEFTPKLVADVPNPKPAKKKSGDNGAEAEEEKSEEEQAQPERKEQAQSALDLGAPVVAAKAPTKAALKTARENLVAVILKCDETDLHYTFAIDEAETLADAIIAAGFGVTSPI